MIPSSRIFCDDNGLLNIWTNPSVRYLLPGNPVEEITTRARDLVLNAIEKGWAGPPFDPFELAGLLNIDVHPSSEIPDARTVPRQGGRFLIEYNPEKPKARIRYSICHEIAHTLFPDCRDQIRNRGTWHRRSADAWQLEMLCNIAASELLMPIGSFRDLVQSESSLDALLRARMRFGVSLEATLLRFAKLTQKACVVFAARLNSSTTVLEYAAPSHSYDVRFHTLFSLPADTVVRKTTMSKGSVTRTERWGRFGSLRVQAIALPPHKNDAAARAAGIAFPLRNNTACTGGLQFLVGDATQPHDDGPRLIAHIVNDKSPFWGAGFARSLRTRWPKVQRDFSSWAIRDRSGFRLGNVHIAQADGNTVVVSMIAQHGFGPTTTPRIRYSALAKCLSTVAAYAREQGMSVHIPRIGCGQAGGYWPIVDELLKDSLYCAGVKVSVYDLPDYPFIEVGQQALF